MIDAHVHVTAELLPYLKSLCCIANADSPEEYAFLKEAGVSAVSAGIHPWKADITPWSEMEPILREAAVMGEIGLDSVWCNVDMEVQRSVFRRQLELAAQLRKPVILHTKGMEKEVLQTIGDYPNRYLVHWYSHCEHLEEFICLGCWFTVGPNLADQTVLQAAEKVPLDKLLIESDGIDAIAWAQDRTLLPEDYPGEMQRHLQAVAALRQMEPECLLRQMELNLRKFIGG